ncbi:MAG: hypothetical protein ACXW0J_07800 [Nitrososphaeraceae archaeon]
MTDYFLTIEIFPKLTSDNSFLIYSIDEQSRAELARNKVHDIIAKNDFRAFIHSYFAEYDIFPLGSTNKFANIQTSILSLFRVCPCNQHFFGAGFQIFTENSFFPVSIASLNLKNDICLFGYDVKYFYKLWLTNKGIAIAHIHVSYWSFINKQDLSTLLPCDKQLIFQCVERMLKYPYMHFKDFNFTTKMYIDFHMMQPKGLYLKSPDIFLDFYKQYLNWNDFNIDSIFKYKFSKKYFFTNPPILTVESGKAFVQLHHYSFFKKF